MRKPETLKLLGHLSHITRPYTLEMSCVVIPPPQTVTWSPEFVTH